MHAYRRTTALNARAHGRYGALEVLVVLHELWCVVTERNREVSAHRRHRKVGAGQALCGCEYLSRQRCA
eukprot:28624-Eustigmatos_ZCMA.PRE.1